MLLTLTLPSLVILSNVWGIELPEPKGPFQVGTTSFELTDYTRLDPFAPTPQNRSVQLSLYYPILNGNTRPYLPFLTANNTEVLFGASAGSLQNISTHAHLNASILHGGLKHPVVLFSPGLGVSRLIYATFCQNLASEGYTVISIDHPYDASIVELSDGRVITGIIPDDSPPEIYNLAMAVRAADASFVLDELAAGRNFKVPGFGKSDLDTSRVGFFGHSLGGATAATTMILDEQIVCAVNMDGSFFGPDILRGFSKPFMILESEGHNRVTDPT